MRPIYKIAGACLVPFLLYLALAPDAQAAWGRGAAFIVGAAVGSTAGSSEAKAEAAASEQQKTAAQQQAAAEKQKAEAAQKEAEAAKKEAEAAKKEAEAAREQAAAAGPLPVGTVVASLPAGCKSAPSGGVNYYECGGNVYQAVFEGSTLKYVTTKPK